MRLLASKLYIYFHKLLNVQASFACQLRQCAIAAPPPMNLHQPAEQHCITLTSLQHSIDHHAIPENLNNMKLLQGYSQQHSGNLVLYIWKLELPVGVSCACSLICPWTSGASGTDSTASNAKHQSCLLIE